MTTTTRVGKLSYDQKNILGRGNFGTVYGGIYIYSEPIFGKPKSMPVAVKRFERGRVKESVVQQEVDLMKKAGDHPNILSYIHTEMSSDFLFIATELCCGTLEEYVKGTYNGEKIESEREILLQITQGLSHLHNLKIVHRDIKPRNILIFVPYEGIGFKPLMKLADFGLSKVPKDGNEDVTNTNTENPSGSRAWMPPEVYGNERLNFKFDIWALGCIFAYTLSGGKHPFGDDMKRIIRIMGGKCMVLNQKDLIQPYSKDPFAFELIKSMLSVEPTSRPTVGDVSNNCFLIHPALRTKQLLKVCNSFENLITTECIDLFEKLVRDKSVDVNVKMKSEYTPLHVLCRYYEKDNLIDLVKLVTKKGAQINAKDQNGQTPLHILCSFYENDNLINVVQLLIEKGADSNVKDKNGVTPLHCVCLKYDNDHLVDVVQLLLHAGAKADAKDRNGMSVLHCLCSNYKNQNLKDIFKVLIDKGAQVDVKDNLGVTPLHELCKKYKNDDLMDLVQFLMQKGAKLEASDFGSTPLHYLCSNYQKENLKDIVQLMIQKRVDVTVKNKKGYTSLHLLCFNYGNDNLIDIVQLLIQKGAQVNAVDQDGWTPLHWLCRFYQNDNKGSLKDRLISLVNVFVENGANVNARNKEGKTPFDILRARGILL